MEKALKACGIDPMDFAGLAVDETGEYGLRYEEFISLLVAKIQNLDAQIKEIAACMRS